MSIFTKDYNVLLTIRWHRINDLQSMVVEIPYQVEGLASLGKCVSLLYKKAYDVALHTRIYTNKGIVDPKLDVAFLNSRGEFIHKLLEDYLKYMGSPEILNGKSVECSTDGTYTVKITARFLTSL